MPTRCARRRAATPRHSFSSADAAPSIPEAHEVRANGKGAVFTRATCCSPCSRVHRSAPRARPLHRDCDGDRLAAASIFPGFAPRYLETVIGKMDGGQGHAPHRDAVLIRGPRGMSASPNGGTRRLTTDHASRGATAPKEATPDTTHPIVSRTWGFTGFLLLRARVHGDQAGAYHSPDSVVKRRKASSTVSRT